MTVTSPASRPLRNSNLQRIKNESAKQIRFGFHAEKPMLREQVLNALEDYETYCKVFNESIQDPSEEVKRIREELSRKKLDLKEITASKNLLFNFYYSSAEALREKAKNNPSKKETEKLLNQANLLEEAASIENPTSTRTFKGSVRFSGWGISLFTKMLNTVPKGNPKSMSRKERETQARKIIGVGSGLAGATAGILTKSFIADDAALTLITVGTIKVLSRKVYGAEGTTEAIMGVVAGKILGARVAAKILNVIPAIGEIANASTAYGLHQATGWLFVAYYESQLAQGKDPEMPKKAKAILNALSIGYSFLGDAQASEEKLHRTFNDALVKVGEAEAVHHDPVFVDLSQHSVYIDGHIHSLPKTDWWFMTVTKGLSDILGPVELAKRLKKFSKLSEKDRKNLFMRIHDDLKNNKALSTKTRDELLDEIGLSRKDIDKLTENLLDVLDL